MGARPYAPPYGRDICSPLDDPDFFGYVLQPYARPEIRDPFRSSSDIYRRARCLRNHEGIKNAFQEKKGNHQGAR